MTEQGNLLRPTLEADGAGMLPLSPNVAFYLGFLGCTLGTAIYGAANARRLGVLRTQWPLYVGAAVIGLGVDYAVLGMPRDVVTRDLFGLQVNYDGWARLAPRVAGLAFAGIFFLVNRSQFAARRLAGGDFASPWLVAGGALLADLAITVGFVLMAQAGRA